MSTPLSVGLASLVALYGFAILPIARANSYDTSSLMPGSSCQLSIPTTDTKARPKATGFRNESTTASSFAICPLAVVNTSGNGFKYIDLSLYSFDGKPHAITCTAVKGSSYTSLQYSSITINDPGNVSLPPVEWSDANFGGTAGNPIFIMSVTCLLPPQTAVDAISGVYAYQIGA